jgi:tripartite-type tricarboxylate transporter receptor subunit TctC
MGGFPQLCPAYLFGLAGVQSQPIPFKGGGPAVTAILGGHVDVCSAHPGEVYPHIKAGKLRPLAISSLQRFPDLADVPTMKEKGYDIDMGVKKFIFAPRGLADDVRNALVDALTKVSQDPGFKKTMTDSLLMLEPLSGKQVVDYFNTQAPIMKKLIEDMAKIQPPQSK